MDLLAGPSRSATWARTTPRWSRRSSPETGPPPHEGPRAPDAARTESGAPRLRERVLPAVRRLVALAAIRTWRAIDRLFSQWGPLFTRLALANSASTCGDVLIGLALAGTLFFSVPSTNEARLNVALYLLITVAPFAVLSPALGVLLSRFPTGYRYGIFAAGVLRAVAVVALMLELHTLWLYPLALVMLVLSRLHTVSRASLLPVALPDPSQLVAANARLAQLGVVAGAVVVPVGLGVARLVGGGGVLLLAAAAFGATAVAATGLPAAREVAVAPSSAVVGPRVRSPRLPRGVRLAQLATAAVRLLNGYLLLLLAFALRRVQAGLLDFASLLAAGGFGFMLAALVAPVLDRRVREEPVVVMALALEGGAAFIAGQSFGVAAAAALATTAGVAWGVAKLAFDGLLQAGTHPDERGLLFTRSETLFAIAWVAGAIIPVAVPLPTGLGLAAAGVAALVSQVVYVAAVLGERRPTIAGTPPTHDVAGQGPPYDLAGPHPVGDTATPRLPRANGGRLPRQ